MTTNVFVSDPISEEGLVPLRQAPNFNVKVKTGLKGADLLKEVADCEALLVRSETKVTAEVIAAAKKLRFIGRAGTGVDNIDLGAASRQGIVVANVPGGNTISAAEQTLALLVCVGAEHAPGGRLHPRGEMGTGKICWNGNYGQDPGRDGVGPNRAGSGGAGHRVGHAGGGV
jgi:phosphoglycerate dehydrogenase-like enzyme